MKAGTKVLASFKAGMNSPNLPWHVNITSLKHRSQFGEVPCFRQVEIRNENQDKRKIFDPGGIRTHDLQVGHRRSIN